MSITLPVQIDPHARVQCSHLRDGVCVAAADATGVRIVVTPPVCNITCPTNGGPKGGQPLPEDDGKWAVSMLRYAWGTSMRKVAERYAKPFDVWVPEDIVPAVREAFASIIALPWVEGIGLTGSILSRGTTHKDIDVVLMVTDVRAYLDALPTLDIPKTVANLKVDVFFRTRRASWFLLLDLADYTLYRSGVYNLASVDPRITVVDVGDGFKAFRDKPTPSTPAPSHWGTPLWKWLHEWAGTTADLSPAALTADLKAFAYRVPCGDCQNHWLSLVKQTPPPFDNRPALQRWTYDRHAEVSKRIGKPSPTYAQAARQWWTPRDKIIVPDRVAVISLDSRPDRWQAFTESVKRSKLLGSWDIERFRARPLHEMIVPDFWKFPPSTWASDRDHRQIVETSYVAGHEWVMIFEDDAIAQDCFDDTYTAACQFLPADAYALMLTTDGHVRQPSPIMPGLNRSNMQYFLHAYLTSRRGMHKLFSAWERLPDKVADGTASNLMPDGGFFSVQQNAVIQTGDRTFGERTEFYRSGAA